ncbi:DUF378 domain-containing protein [Oceanobacillus sp. M65]|jgi:uncharacterized protein|uniref:DUF378 domain-containing protein n=1 Tax=Oceanobacillus jordanicus TaxID=2867266 RepID=A0AAW5B5C8_9BACI|nr:DUF378 domain-containing protein [Oceanobacillus jordanicus]MCG3419611.1 DUF378 domain-containing protein [Oceanobacillus jordanicus]
MNGLQRAALALTIIGAVNWGLIALFQFDLVAAIFGGGEQSAALARIIYGLVGISGLVLIPLLFKTDEAFSKQREPDRVDG